VEREILVGLGCLAVAYELSTFAFSRRLKQEEKQKRGLPTSMLEAHHKTPRYLGGSDSLENMEILTRPEHALTHWLRALIAPDHDQASAEYWAVSQIVRRMTPSELQQFNSEIKRR
jgi:hypothetical protein